MIPHFNKKTIETLAKRAAYRCSNPDCNINTVGPNSEHTKSTLIGEAAHIYGARPSSKRYNKEMTDASRAEITNGIWLCRNCHKLIDNDEKKYSPDILFLWREQHENCISLKLGNPSDKIFLKEQKIKLEIFDKYPPIIKRIIIDKPNGWEWRLTAELMRYHNNPIFRKIEDLKDGLYIKEPKFIKEEEMLNWIQSRLTESMRLIEPISVLLDRLNKSWGKPGEEGDIKEIHHITTLIKEYLLHVVSYEEKIYFIDVPEKYNKIIHLLKNNIGSQVLKLASIPNSLDEMVLLAENDGNSNPKKLITIKKTIILELPKGWEKEFKREFNKLYHPQSNCLSIILLLIIVSFFISFL